MIVFPLEAKTTVQVIQAIKSPLSLACRGDYSVKALWPHIPANAVKDREGCHGLRRVFRHFSVLGNSWEPMLNRDLTCVWKSTQHG